jgi:hypothetical protein
MILTGCCNACSTVARGIGSGVRRDVIKFLAERKGWMVMDGIMVTGMQGIPISETFFQYRSWNSTCACVVSLIRTFMSSDRNGKYPQSRT